MQFPGRNRGTFATIDKLPFSRLLLPLEYVYNIWKVGRKEERLNKNKLLPNMIYYCKIKD